MTNHRVVMSGGRYPVLRAFAIIYVFAGIIAAISGVVGAIYLLSRSGLGSPLDRAFMAIAALIGAFFMTITMLAVAEVLKLFIDIEHNTRMGVAGAIGMPKSIAIADTPAGVAVTTSTQMPANRLDSLDEETAEAALLRGH